MLETVKYFLYIPENDIIGISGNNILSFLEYYRQNITDFRKQNVYINIDSHFKRLSNRLNCSITVPSGFDIKNILNVLYMDSEGVGICYAHPGDIFGTPHIVTAKATDDDTFEQNYYPKNGILNVNRILSLSDRQEGDLKWVLIYDTDNSMDFRNEEKLK